MARVLLLLPTTTYRTRDFLDAAERLGVEVVVGSEETSTMEALSPERLLTLPLRAAEEAADRVARFHARVPLDAVVPVDEDTAVIAAAIAGRLGLPHNAPEAAVRARLKHRMREALASAGLHRPAFRVARVDDDPDELADALRYPVVLKPVFLSGSRGVVRADDPASFVARFRWLARFLGADELRERGGPDAEVVLIEEYVPGREVALEGLLTSGSLRPLALFDKPDPLEGPVFEETIYVTPSRLPEEIQRSVREMTARAARAMGLEHGPIHAELRLSESGPVVVEIAGRSIGGLCSRTLRFGLGVSLEELILRHALGTDVSELEREWGAAGVMMIPIPAAGELREIRGLEEARGVEGIEEVTLTAHVGKALVPLPEGSSYLGFIFARAQTPERVERALREAHRRLVFEVAPRELPARTDEGPRVSDETALVYRIDPRDELVFVNDAWNEHARGAGCAELVGSRVLHRSLWEFVNDVTTEHVYRELFRRVRRGRVVSFEFQCDAPSERRRLEMTIVPLVGGGLELRTTVLAREPRPPIEVSYTRDASSPHPRMCSWCKRVELRGEWVAIEEAITGLALFRRTTPPTFTHGICPSCGDKLSEPGGSASDYFAGE